MPLTEIPRTSVNAPKQWNEVQNTDIDGDIPHLDQNVNHSVIADNTTYYQSTRISHSEFFHVRIPFNAPNLKSQIHSTQNE